MLTQLAVSGGRGAGVVLTMREEIVKCASEFLSTANQGGIEKPGGALAAGAAAALICNLSLLGRDFSKLGDVLVDNCFDARVSAAKATKKILTGGGALSVEEKSIVGAALKSALLEEMRRSLPHPPTMRARRGSSSATAEHLERSESISGPGEKVMVATSRISVVL